jgi:mevalonate kinase
VRGHLAFIESAFHLKSSGTDPLVSYLNKPVFIRNGEIYCPDLSMEDLAGQLTIGLIDSGIPGVTKSGVGAFQSVDFLDRSGKQVFEKDYIPLINSMVESIYHNRPGNLMDKVLQISELQLLLFPNLFTPQMAVAARQGLDSREFAIKLCGSGGGGYYLKLSAGRE